MYKAKYLVTGSFGNSHVGEITDCFVLASSVDDNMCLVFHPTRNNKVECGSMEFCKRNEDGNMVSVDNELYLNLSVSDNKLFKRFLREHNIR